MPKYQSFSYWEAQNEPGAISSIFRPFKGKFAIIVVSNPVDPETLFITMSFPYGMNWWFFRVPLNFGELVSLDWRNSEIFSTSDVSTKRQVTPVISFFAN